MTLVDLGWMQDAVDAGDAAPSIAIPDRGSRGTGVRIVHPALLDPGVVVTAELGDVELPFTRGLPGYGTAIVPVDAVVGGTTITLWVDDAIVGSLPFEVLDPPADAAPEDVIDAIDRSLVLLSNLPDLMDEATGALTLGDTEQELLDGLLVETTEILSEQFAEMQATFALLDPEAQALFAEVAFANGLGEVLVEIGTAEADLLAIQRDMGGLSIGASSRVIQVVCTAQTITDISGEIARINEIVGIALGYLDFPGARLIPFYGTVVAALSNISSIISAITEVIDIISGFLPKIGDSLDVEPDDDTLEPGDTANFTVTTTLQIAQGLCEGSVSMLADPLVGRLKSLLIRRIGSIVPGFDNAYRAARGERDRLSWFYMRVYDAVSYLVDRVAEAVDVPGLIGWLASNFCSLVLGDSTAIDPVLTLDPADVIQEPSCGSTLGGSYTCEQECADENVRVPAMANLCGEMLSGSTSVLCVGCRGSCTDGCCDGQTCVPFAEQTGELCGVSGECMMCNDGEVCSDGECICESTCSAMQAAEMTRMCNADVLQICEEVEAGCYRWREIDCAARGGTCNAMEGNCEGGCGLWNCNGCCTGANTCVDEMSVDEMACGAGASMCQMCVTGEECLGGTCVCTDPMECDPPSAGGGSVGDPHIFTFDGYLYDFQGAGEFVLARTTDLMDPFEVQARQVAVPGFRCDVTMNTGIAIDIGVARVAFYADESDVWVDGSPTVVAEGTTLDLGGGAGITRLANTRWMVSDGRGNRVTVQDSGFFLDVRVEPAADRFGGFEGLLGNFNTLPEDDIAPAGGGPALLSPVSFEDLYDIFGDSYRVDAGSSLFDYAMGEGPDTFYVPGFPNQLEGVPTVDGMDIPTAEAACDAAGVAPLLRDACILDVACTGDTAFADALAATDPGDGRWLRVSEAVDLASWTAEGASSDWFEIDADVRVQLDETAPTFFVSDADRIGFRYTGLYQSAELVPHNYAGYVLGYNGPLTENADASTDYDFILISHNGESSSNGGFVSPEGFTVARVNGSITDPLPGFWGQIDSAEYDVWATDHGAGRGWRELVVYDVEIIYTRDRLQFLIDDPDTLTFNNEVIFDLTPADVGLTEFPNGRFGFYTYDQTILQFWAGRWEPQTSP